MKLIFFIAINLCAVHAWTGFFTYSTLILLVYEKDDDAVSYVGIITKV